MGQGYRLWLCLVLLRTPLLRTLPCILKTRLTLFEHNNSGIFSVEYNLSKRKIRFGGHKRSGCAILSLTR